MFRDQKENIVGKMRTDVEKAAGVYFFDFTGLTVEEADGFRLKLRGANIHYQVVKNTLLTRALADQPFSDASKCLKGTPTGVVIGWDDPVTPAKIAFEYMKDCKHLKVKGGVVDSKSINPAQAEALSEMPSKEELQGQIIALAMAPGAQLAAQIKSPAGRIAGAIEALVDRLEASA